MLPKAHLTLHSRTSGSRWVITPSWLSGSWRSFLHSSSVYSCHLFLIASAFELWCWRRLLRVPWTTRRSNQSNWFPKGNQSWIFIGRTDAEALILWPPGAKNWLIRKDPDAGKDWRQEAKGTTEGEIVGWHHQLNRHEFKQALGDSKGQAWRAAVQGVTKSRTKLSNWITAT